MPAARRSVSSGGEARFADLLLGLLHIIFDEAELDGSLVKVVDAEGRHRHSQNEAFRPRLVCWLPVVDEVRTRNYSLRFVNPA
jgi:hypothetical protein